MGLTVRTPIGDIIIYNTYLAIWNDDSCNFIDYNWCNRKKLNR